MGWKERWTPRGVRCTAPCSTSGREQWEEESLGRGLHLPTTVRRQVARMVREVMTAIMTARRVGRRPRQNTVSLGEGGGECSSTSALVCKGWRRRRVWESPGHSRHPSVPHVEVVEEGGEEGEEGSRRRQGVESPRRVRHLQTGIVILPNYDVL